MGNFEKILEIQKIPVPKGDSFADMQPGDYVLVITVSDEDWEYNAASLGIVTNDFSIKKKEHLYLAPAIPPGGRDNIVTLPKPIGDYTDQRVVETNIFFGGGAIRKYAIRIPTRLREEVWKLWVDELKKSNYGKNVLNGFINI